LRAGAEILFDTVFDSKPVHQGCATVRGDDAGAMCHNCEESPDRRPEQEHGRTTKRAGGEGPFVLRFAEVEVDNGKVTFVNRGT
jgi:hypothetical protein